MVLKSESVRFACLMTAGLFIYPTGSLATDSSHKSGRIAPPATGQSEDIHSPIAMSEFVLTKSGRIVPETVSFESDENPISGVFDSSIITGSISPELGLISDEKNTDKSVLNGEVASCGPSPLEPKQIRALVSEAAKHEGIDEQFALAIVEAESQNDRIRNSPKGARGPMQLMSETAVRYGVTDICDPADNIAGGIAYLKDLTEQFRNPMLVAAAYNAGEQSIYRYEGIPPFRETVTYVAKVMNLSMGISLPRHAGDRHFEAAASTTHPSTQEPETGVIQAPKRGAFVAGVMQF